MSSQQKEDQHACRVTRESRYTVREMLGTLRIAAFFQWFVVFDVRKVASLKRRVPRQLFSRQMKKWHAAVARSTFVISKCTKHHNRGAIFEVPMFKKLHAAVAKRTFGSENVKKNWRCRSNFGSCDPAKLHATVAKKHIWKWKCYKTDGVGAILEVAIRQKFARYCGTKDIFKSKCAKHLSAGPILEIPIQKNCTPLWRKAHF